MALVISTQAYAQTSPSALPGFCLLSRGAAIASSHAGAAARSRLAQIEAAMAHSSEQQKALIALEGEELARRREQMTALEFEGRANQLRSRSRALEQLETTRAKRLAEARLSAQERIDTALDPIIDQLRLTRHCVVIMERNNAYVYANNLDLTAETTARLNDTLQSFEIATPR